MAYSQQFSDRLLQQVNETNARNLHLEALLAQRDDQLAHAQRTLAGQIGGSLPASFDFQLQLQKANERASNAEANLNNSISTFDKEYKKQQKQIRTLKNELEAARCSTSVTRAPASTEESSRIISLEKELEKNKYQLQNLKTAYAGLQRQLKAEQRENSRRQNLPRTNPAKAVSIGDDDQDDEEPEPPQIKQEPRTSISYGSSSMLSPPPPPQLSRPRTRSSQSSVPISRRNLTSSNMAVTLAHRPKVDSNTTRESSAILPTSNKRRRSTYGEDNLQENLEGVADSDRDDPAPSRKRTRGSRGSIWLTDSGPRDDDHEDLKRRLSFLGITSYDDQGRPGGFNARELDDCMPMLWERIRMIVNLWEEKTEAWKETIEDRVKMSKSKTPICVSSKLKIEGREHGNSKWREGCEGKYACRKCVEENVPCFTWTGEEFRLLPLHKMDRKYPDRKDHEIRFWLNEA
ncbi:Hypothetical predicted protein [Lecanosticta acicola]|uniref:Uncharacterized protein n=1 Tax=Lecanosticta acicola TaxID=111012 RepID=A0AAI8YX40_9PEZI|nr:Hypothetical predicted protein [Lecanosticta acicola]